MNSSSRLRADLRIDRFFTGAHLNSVTKNSPPTKEPGDTAPRVRLPSTIADRDLSSRDLPHVLCTRPLIVDDRQSSRSGTLLQSLPKNITHHLPLTGEMS